MAFFELNIAMSGLFAAQRGLQVTSNNISNANTQGYSRQILSQTASKPLSGYGVGLTGTGVTTTGVNRVRDSLIDQKIWTQSASLGEANIKVTQNSIMESAFGEPSESGFTKVFNDMFSAMSQLSLDPTASESKITLKEEMISFTKYFNNIAAKLEKQQRDLNFEIKVTVDEINAIATRIQSLNQQIADAELYGSEASSFRDERDKCIDRLSQIVDVEVSEEPYQVLGRTQNRFMVKIAGQVLVDHINVNTLEIEERTDADKLNEEDVDGLYNLAWSNGLSFDMTKASISGELKGLIDMRDGCGSNGVNTYNGVPYYMQQLNTYVRDFAKMMNEQYLKGDPVEDEHALFTYMIDDKPVTGKGTVDYSKLTAANFSISKEVDDEPLKMTTLSDNNNPSDSSFMVELFRKKDSKDMNFFENATAKEYMISLFSQLGVNAKESEMYQSTNTSITQNLENQRLSNSQVDTTEEFTYLIRYQQAYQAAAKVMNTIDGIYETTIFKLGNF